MLQQEALKYCNKKEFHKDSTNAHHAASRRGILNKICQHMLSAGLNRLMNE
jgi:hypothetical protein